MQNHMRVEFDAVSQNESFARFVAGAFFTQLNPTLEEIADVKTAVSEAVTNCIVHGYQGQKGTVIMECIISGDEMTLRIIDQGVGIKDIDKARQPFFTTSPGDERSGMGFTVMETFMDGLSIDSTYGRGTCVCMKKKIAAANALQKEDEEDENAAG